MKNQFPTLKMILRISTVCILAILICACESHEEAADTAFNHIRDQGQLPIDTPITTAALPTKPTQKSKTIKKVEVIDSWTLFTNKTTKQIIANDSSIKEIKTTSGNTKSIKKAIALEKANSDLKAQIAQYKEQEKERLDKFQAQMLLQLNTLHLDLAAIQAANTK